MFSFAMNLVIVINICLAAIPTTNLETVCASELPFLLFSVIVSDTNMFHSYQQRLEERDVSRNCD